jgi:hypothetical protein
VSSQKPIPAPCTLGESEFPFDFSDKFYFNHGVEVMKIDWRRNGMDGFSVFDKNCHPNFTEVRVTVTAPAYDQNGAPVFWYPLGYLNHDGFTPDRLGKEARRAALENPIYTFPDPRVENASIFTSARQAPLLDLSAVNMDAISNPLGLRVVYVVNYTEKATTKEGMDLMAFFGKKNGLAADDTPLIKSMDDITFLRKFDLVTVDSFIEEGIHWVALPYAISPMITKKGAIAPDAFLWTVTKGGEPLPGEQEFLFQFECMKKAGWMCEN